MHSYRAAVAALLTLAGVPLAAFAAPNGLAWDSVTKVVMSADPSSLQPGSFDSDFAAAAAVQAPSAGAAQGAQQMMQTGIAERHYVAGSKERTDNLARQTATIADCVARTITTLDLRGKTYRVVSMDQPSAPGSGAGAGPRTPFLQNGASIAVSVANTALGALVVGGQPTNGFRSDVKFAMTSPSGESNTRNGVLVGYYSAYAKPAPPCSGGIFAEMLGGAHAMARFEQLMSAVSSGGTNLHISVKQNGPLLPVGKLAMFEALSFQMLGHGTTMVTERGNVRAIAVDDPVFSIPPGFTKQQ